MNGSEMPNGGGRFWAARGPELTTQLTAKMAQIRTLYAEMLDLVAEMNQEQVARDAGYSSLPAFLVETLRITPTKASKMVTQASQVAETVTPTGHVTPAPLPNVRAALHAGLVDAEHVDAVVEAVKKLPAWASTDHRELVESTLAGTAEVSQPRVVREHGRILLERIDQDGTAPEEKTPKQANSFRYRRTQDGGMEFTGRVDTEAADELEALFHPLTKPEPEDERTPQERQGDAMAAVIHLAANSGDAPAAGGEKPHLNLTLDYDVLRDRVGTAVLEGGAVLGPAAARRLACDADLIPMVLNGESVALDVGRERRLVTAKQRRALIARDQGCAFPDCPLPPRWCDAHHIKHWVDGGKTDVANMVLLCRRHHRVTHGSEWTIHVANGIPYFRPPRWRDPAQTPVRNILRR